MNFVSTAVKIIDNMQNVVLKKMPDFGIDYPCNFCVILFFPRVIGNICRCQVAVKLFHTSTPGEQWLSHDLVGRYATS